MHHHNYTVTDMCDTTCAMLTENGVDIFDRKENSHRGTRNLDIYGRYGDCDIALNVEFDKARGAFSGYCTIYDYETTYLDEFGDVLLERCSCSLDKFCKTCIEDYGICRPEHIVSAAIDYFNHNINS